MSPLTPVARERRQLEISAAERGVPMRISEERVDLWRQLATNYRMLADRRKSPSLQDATVAAECDGLAAQLDEAAASAQRGSHAEAQLSHARPTGKIRLWRMRAAEIRD